jgi:hypothetical protein
VFYRPLGVDELRFYLGLELLEKGGIVYQGEMGLENAGARLREFTVARETDKLPPRDIQRFIKAFYLAACIFRTDAYPIELSRVTVKPYDLTNRDPARYGESL